MNKVKKLSLLCSGIVVALIGYLAYFSFTKVHDIDLTFEGTSGIDIYRAVDKADQGLNCWPSDITHRLDFKNSTDYFSALIDEGNNGSSNWNPLVLGLAKKTLSWRGTYSGTTESRLRPDNIMWTVAKNVTADTPSIIPVLITRNVLATSLRTRLSKNEMSNELKFDKTVKTPLGHNFVVIRKDGSMFKATKKYTAYGVVYRGTSFNETTNNRPPIKYLTPYSEVTPDNH